MSINPEEQEVDSQSEFDFEPQFEESPESETLSTKAPDEEIEAAIEEAEEEEETVQAVEETREEGTPRAQKRIRQLAEQKNELQSRNEELLALVEQLKKSNELTAQMQEKQNQFWSAQENQNKAHQRRQLMQQYGLNPDDVRDNIAYEQMEYKSQLEQQLQEVQQQLQQQQEAVQVERFNHALDQSLQKRLKDYSVEDGVYDNIREVAYDIAALRGVTAGEAADAAVQRLQNFLPKKKRRAAKADPAANLVAKTGNRAKGKAPGQAAESGDDFMSLLDSGKFFL